MGAPKRGVAPWQLWHCALTTLATSQGRRPVAGAAWPDSPSGCGPLAGMPPAPVPAVEGGELLPGVMSPLPAAVATGPPELPATGVALAPAVACGVLGEADPAALVDSWALCGSPQLAPSAKHIPMAA